MAMKVSSEKRHYIIDQLFSYGLPALTLFYSGLATYHHLFVPGGGSKDGIGMISILCAMLSFGLIIVHKVMRGDYDRRG